MAKNNLLITIVVAVVAVGLGFFGGMQYSKTKTTNNMPTGGQRLGGPSGSQQRINSQTGAPVSPRPVSGDIISIDTNSITIKTQDGSTKILTYSSSTKVSKTTDGSISDLKVGDQVTAQGSESTQGTITTQNIYVGNGMLQGGGDIPPEGSQSGNGQKPAGQ